MTTETRTASFTVTNLNHLPSETLRAMAQQVAGRKRINAIHVKLTNGLASRSTSWRSGGGEVVIGKLARRVRHSWVGSDGESNVTVTDYFSCAVASASTQHRRAGCEVKISLGNVPLAMVEQLEASSIAEFEPMLPVAVDAALAGELEVGELVEVVDSFDSTVMGGSRGEASSMVARSSLSADVRAFEAPASKANTIKVSRSFTTHATARSAARHGNVETNAHVDAMAAAGWLS